MCCEECKPFPMWALLVLYHNSSARDTYIEYHEGLKELINWLGPIEVPTEYQLNYRLPPKLFHSYELQEFSKLVGADQSIVYQVYLDLLTRGLIK